MRTLKTALAAIAALLGASGVAAAAASSHAGAELLAPYALIALTHAPALLALALAPPARTRDIAAIVLALGAALFCADLALRHMAGHGLFPLSAPLGGITMILGWLGIGLSALFERR